MRRITRTLAALVAALVAAFAAGCAHADEVPYVKTPQAVVDAMLGIAAVRGTDFLYDLGSGDGRIPITAAQRYGARALGVDYDPYLVEESTRNARAAGVGQRVAFVQKNIFDVDLSPATVVTMYLLPAVNIELRPKLLATLRPGTRVVSHDWDMGDWEPDAQVDVPAPDKPVGVRKESTVYLWIVPGQAAGEWRTQVPLPSGRADVVLEIDQRYQMLSGFAQVGDRRHALERAFMRGPRVFFRFGEGASAVRFEGQLFADRMVGRVTTADERTHVWRAQRRKPAG
jgi:hypothetical protein